MSTFTVPFLSLLSQAQPSIALQPCPSCRPKRLGAWLHWTVLPVLDKSVLVPENLTLIVCAAPFLNDAGVLKLNPWLGLPSALSKSSRYMFAGLVPISVVPS